MLYQADPEIFSPKFYKELNKRERWTNLYDTEQLNEVHFAELNASAYWAGAGNVYLAKEWKKTLRSHRTLTAAKEKWDMFLRCFEFWLFLPMTTAHLSSEMAKLAKKKRLFSKKMMELAVENMENHLEGVEDPVTLNSSR